VLEKAAEVKRRLSAKYRVKLDDRDTYSVGWKFNEWELKGVPVRLEIGPRDISSGQVVAVRRDTGEKIPIAFEELEGRLSGLLEDIQLGIFKKALRFRDSNIRTARDMEEMVSIMENQMGFVKAFWCESAECEAKVKEKTGATIRCIPFEQAHGGGECIVCGRDAERFVYFAKAY
jgi:prolyl-tRNA synthetase